ncbi:MAG: hypothetical protein R3C56_23735 [Pirellulaceae bacterium]
MKFRPLTLPAAGSLLATVTQPEPSLVVALKNQKLIRVALDDAAVLAEWPYETELLQIHASSGGESLLTIATDGSAAVEVGKRRTLGSPRSRLQSSRQIP